MKTWAAWWVLFAAGSLGAAESVPLFNAVLSMGRENRFVLVDGQGKASSFLSLGESFTGFKLKAYDAKAGVLEIEREGRVHQLSLVADAAVASAPAAPTPATLADATALMDAMHFEQMMDWTFAMLRKQQGAMIERMMAQAGGPSVEKDAAVAFQKKMLDEFMGALSGAELKADVAQIYSQIFSKDELQALAGFYASPLGEMFSEKQPLLAEKMNEAIMPRVMKVMPKVQQMAKEFAQEQKARREAAKGAATEPKP